MKFLFGNARALEAEVDDFLDAVSEGIMVFEQGIRDYLEGDSEDFGSKIQQIGDYEGKADRLRREIENQLYSHSLIPEHRGDVLGLLENTDHVIDTAKETLNQFEVERPDFPADLRADLLKLTRASLEAAEALVMATRAFFRDINTVKDHLHKVYFYEKEADRLGDQLKHSIFSKDMGLSHKIHLRYFAAQVESISDRAEEVADRLSIYTIKRKI